MSCSSNCQCCVEHRLVARFVGDDSHLPAFACPANCFHPFQEAFLRELLLPFSDGAPQVVAGCVRHFPDGGSHVLANLRQHAAHFAALRRKRDGRPALVRLVRHLPDKFSCRHLFHDVAHGRMRLSDLPGDSRNGLRPSLREGIEHGKPFWPDVHSIQPVNLRRIVRNAVGQHSQTASDRHFSCSVEKVHILRFVYRY